MARKLQTKVLDRLFTVWGDLELAHEALTKSAAGNGEHPLPAVLYEAETAIADYLAALADYARTTRS